MRKAAIVLSILLVLGVVIAFPLLHVAFAEAIPAASALLQECHEVKAVVGEPMSVKLAIVKRGFLRRSRRRQANGELGPSHVRFGVRVSGPRASVKGWIHLSNQDERWVLEPGSELYESGEGSRDTADIKQLDLYEACPRQ